MKNIFFAFALALTACSSSEEKKIPAQPADIRHPNQEQLASSTEIFGNYQTIDTLKNEIYLTIQPNGLFRRVTIDHASKEESVIEGFMKIKTGDKYFSLISNDEKYIFPLHLNDDGNLSAVNDKGELSIYGAFTRILPGQTANTPLETKEEAEKAASTPKNTVITDPASIEKIKKLKESRGK